MNAINPFSSTALSFNFMVALCITGCSWNSEPKHEYPKPGVFVSSKYGLIHAKVDTVDWYDSTPQPYRLKLVQDSGQAKLIPLETITYCGIQSSPEDVAIYLRVLSPDLIQFELHDSCQQADAWGRRQEVRFTRLNEFVDIGFDWLRITEVDMTGVYTSRATYDLDSIRKEIDSNQLNLLSLNQQLWMLFESNTSYFTCLDTGHETPTYRIELGGESNYRCTSLRFSSIPQYLLPLINRVAVNRPSLL